MEISRWCKPPVAHAKNTASPGRGDGMTSRDFRRPGWGSDSIFAMNRWFAPPANFHDASGVAYLIPFPHLAPKNPTTQRQARMISWNSY